MFRRLAIFAALPALLACGSDSTSPSGPPSITGLWNLVFNYSNSQLSASCFTQSVTANITQSGSTFSGVAQSGTLVCTVGATQQVNAFTGAAFTGGQVVGSSVSFNSGGCILSGDVSGSPPNRMSGPVNCQIPISGSTFIFTGTWSATR
jgi:hypothetical protein